MVTFLEGKPIITTQRSFVNMFLFGYFLEADYHYTTIIFTKAIPNIGTEILNFQCLNCLQNRLFCKSTIFSATTTDLPLLSSGSVRIRFKAIFEKSDFFDLAWKLLTFSTWNEIYWTFRLYFRNIDLLTFKVIVFFCYLFSKYRFFDI